MNENTTACGTSDKSAETPNRGHGCKYCPFNYLHPHHTDSIERCDAALGVHNFMHPFDRITRVKEEKPVEKGKAALVPPPIEGNL